MKKTKQRDLFSIKINKNIAKYIGDINSIIDSQIPKTKKIKNKDLAKYVYKCQKEINLKKKKLIIFKLIKKELIKEFKSSKFVVSDFILRYVRKEKFLKPIILHQEKFYGDESWDNIYNLWIPIRNNFKSNSINYIKNSDKFILNRDFIIKEKKTKYKKKSYPHKIGLLYNEKKIHFLKKVKLEKLFEKDKIMIFDGNLIHGNGVNNHKLPRISLDLRFMLKKHLKNNRISNSTGKKYFSYINL